MAAELALRAGLRPLALGLARTRPVAGMADEPAEAVWLERVRLAALPLSLGLWLAIALGLSREFAPLAQARDLGERALAMAVSEPIFAVGSMSYTARDVLLLPLLLVALWLATGFVARLLHARVARVGGRPGGASSTFIALGRHAANFVGAIVVLQAWGIDLRSLAIAASVLGIGIGFGLQDIARNFISGILLGIERPIQPGDFVHVGEHRGTVQRIGARSTAILTQDRVSILVPNSLFLEREVVNWTHGDPVSRLHVPVSLATGTDIAVARAVLLGAAHSHPDVLSDPRPKLELRGFADQSLDFDLLVYTRVPREQSRVKSDLYFRIEEGLRAHGLRTPTAQTEVGLPAEFAELAKLVARHAFDAELAPAPTPAPARSSESLGAVAARWAAFDSALGPREWDDAALAALIERLRAPNGVPVADRRHHFATHRRCFVGREATDWLVRNEGLTRGEAILVGKRLVARGLAHHVLNEHGFEDANLFYRFAADEAS